MEAFLLGLAAITIGALLTFAGYQLFRIIIPIWGFFVGFGWTAQAIALGMGTGFLATAMGWMVGFLVGAALAVLAYLFYEVAVILLAASVGYGLINAFVLGMGFEMGFFSTILAGVAAVALGFAAYYYNAPKALLILMSAVAGATAVIGGFLIMFGVAPLETLGSGLMPAIIGQSFFWVIAWFALMGLGLASQIALTRSIDLFEAETDYYSSYGYGSFAGTKGGAAKRTDTPQDKEKV